MSDKSNVTHCTWDDDGVPADVLEVAGRRYVAVEALLSDDTTRELVDCGFIGAAVEDIVRAAVNLASSRNEVSS